LTARLATARAAWVVDLTFGWSTSNTVVSAGQGHQLIGGQVLLHVIYLLAALCGGSGLAESL
jgi:hypothetical protein